MTQTYYHGTTSEAIPSILKKGLIPAKERGADYAASLPSVAMTVTGYIFDRPKRSPAVYLAKQEKYAETFATITSVGIGGKPAIVKVNVPSNEPLTKDAASPYADAVRCEYVIKPEWIAAYKIGNGHWTLAHQSA